MRPDHLVVLGGGYVGLEFAQAFRRLGSRVTVVERNGRLVHREDPDVSEAVAAAFAAEGVDLLPGTTVDRVTGRSGEAVTLPAPAAGPRSRWPGRTCWRPPGGRRTPTASAWTPRA